MGARFEVSAATIHNLCGCVENGTDTVLKVFQDDATKSWVVQVGRRSYYGATVTAAFAEAVAGEPL